MIESIKSRFPEAIREIENIRQIEDEVETLIATAKEKVATAKESVGDFKCARSYSQPAYDPMNVAQILVSKNASALLLDLFKSGIVKDLKFDKDAARLFLEREQATAEMLKSAWHDREELTPRITVPKVGRF